MVSEKKKTTEFQIILERNKMWKEGAVSTESNIDTRAPLRSPELHGWWALCCRVAATSQNSIWKRVAQINWTNRSC